MKQLFMETITSSTQSYANYTAAADAILAIFDSYQFSTDNPFDPKELKIKIVKAIQVNVEKTVVNLIQQPDGTFSGTTS